MEKISYNELDFIKDSVDPGVVASHCNLLAVNIYSDHSVTGLGELDGVATDTTESVHYDSAGHDLGNVFGNLFRGDGVPGLLVQQDSLVVPREQSVSLDPIFVDTRREVGVGLHLSS